MKTACFIDKENYHLQDCVYCGSKTRVILEIGDESKAICFDCLEKIEDFFAHKTAERESVKGVSFLSTALTRDFIKEFDAAAEWVRNFYIENEFDAHWQIDEFIEQFDVLDCDNIGKKKLLQDTEKLAKNSGQPVKELMLITIGEN